MDFNRTNLRKYSRANLVRDYGVIGAHIGAGIGTIAGIGTGIVLPPYAGWKLGEYIGNKIDLGSYLGTALDISSSALTTLATINLTIPILAVTGLIAGGVIGLTTGSIIGTGKKGLEAILK